jgi:hypothetical protein
MAVEPAEDKVTPAIRTPRLVINEAIRETAGFNALCYWGLVIFGLTGVIAILAAVLRGDAWIGGVGTIPAVLCWPTMRYAILIRKQNINLRLLELTLNNVKSAEQALAAINKAFEFNFGGPEVETDVVVPKSKAKAPRGSS